MSVVDTVPASTQAAILRKIIGEKHPRLAKGNIAHQHKLDMGELDAILNHHGYPDNNRMKAALAELETTAGDRPVTSVSIPSRPHTTATPETPPITRPDEVRVLINTAKGHPSKRIQAAGDRLLDDIDKLKRLIREDEEKHAERRRIASEKAAAKAEVERLKQQLRDAQAKLRPTKTTKSQSGDGPAAADIRAWARENDIAVPDRGVLPTSVRDAYDAAHQDRAAAS